MTGGAVCGVPGGVYPGECTPVMCMMQGTLPGYTTHRTVPSMPHQSRLDDGLTLKHAEVCSRI